MSIFIYDLFNKIFKILFPIVFLLLVSISFWVYTQDITISEGMIQVIVEANLDTTWPPKNNQKGQAELASHTWFWTQKVIKTTDNDMRAIVVEVRFNEDDEFALTSLMTYLSKK